MKWEEEEREGSEEANNTANEAIQHEERPSLSIEKRQIPQPQVATRRGSRQRPKSDFFVYNIVRGVVETQKMANSQEEPQDEANSEPQNQTSEEN